MGDELVLELRDDLADVIFANGLDAERLDPIISTIVNRLRDSGMSDNSIRVALIRGTGEAENG